MKRRRLVIRITLAAVVLVAGTALVCAWLRPGPDSHEWWLARALRESHSMRVSQVRAKLLQRISEGQCEAGDFAGALATVNTMGRKMVPLLKSMKYWARESLEAVFGRGPWPKKPSPLFAEERCAAYSRIAFLQAKAGYAAGAKATAGLIRSHRAFQLRALMHIAQEQALAGDFAGAEATACEIPDGSGYGTDMALEAFKAIAKARAEAGDADAASKVALAVREKLPLAWKKRPDSFYLIIAKGLAGAGKIEAAISFAEDIDNAYPRAQAYRSIVVAHARAGDFDAAKAIARDMGGPGNHAWVYADLARIMAAAGKMTEAREIVESIGYADIRAGTYERICTELAWKGNIDGALEALQYVTDLDAKSRVRRTIVEAQLEAGDLQAARATANLIVGDGKFQAFLLLAEYYSVARDDLAFAQCLGIAKDYVKALDGDEKVNGSCAIAEALAKKGDLDDAIACMNAATKENHFQGVRLPHFFMSAAQRSAAASRLDMVRKIARAYAGIHDPLPNLLPWIKELGSPEDRARAYLGAAQGLIEKQKESSSSED